jgi:hypothetical protein
MISGESFDAHDSFIEHELGIEECPALTPEQRQQDVEFRLKNVSQSKKMRVERDTCFMNSMNRPTQIESSEK